MSGVWEDNFVTMLWGPDNWLKNDYKRGEWINPWKSNPFYVFTPTVEGMEVVINLSNGGALSFFFFFVHNCLKYSFLFFVTACFAR